MSAALELFKTNTRRALTAYEQAGTLNAIESAARGDAASKNPEFYVRRVKEHAEYYLPRAGLAAEWATIDKSARGDATRNGVLDEPYYFRRVKDHAEWLLNHNGRTAEWDTINRSAQGDAAQLSRDYELERFKAHTEYVLNAQGDGPLLAEIQDATNRSVRVPLRKFPVEGHFARDEMEIDVKVSRSGVVEIRCYAGIEKQSGTYQHDFWVKILNEGGETLADTSFGPYGFNLGAAVDSWGRPSFVSDERRITEQVAPNKLIDAASVGFAAQREKGGTTSLPALVKQTAGLLKDMRNDAKTIVEVAQLASAK